MSNLHRIQWIDAELRAGRYPNCARIAERFEISVRQAARDVEYLKYSLGAPVEYSFSRRGFWYTEKTFVLPALFLNEDEKQTLRYLADRYRSAGGETTAKLAAFFEKLEAGGPGPRARPGGEIPVYALTASQVKTYSLLKEAAAGRRKARITYLDPGNRQSERAIRPYIVFIKERADYVHAFCELRGAERDFRLDRITRLAILEERFTLPAAFDPKPYQADYRFVFRLPYRALVRFDGPVPADPPIALVPAEDGAYAIEFSESTELFRRLLAFQTGFSILQPLWLRNKCREFFGNIASKND